MHINISYIKHKRLNVRKFMTHANTKFNLVSVCIRNIPQDCSSSPLIQSFRPLQRCAIFKHMPSLQRYSSLRHLRAEQQISKNKTKTHKTRDMHKKQQNSKLWFRCEESVTRRVTKVQVSKCNEIFLNHDCMQVSICCLKN